MAVKEKTWLIVLAMLDGKKADAEIIEHSENQLTERDLDENYGMAEIVIHKAKTKPEVRPTGELLKAEVQTWLDYKFSGN